MDLTRIVLPTFILERRSLLEMYADFFAHPDIFTDIAVKATPEERMVQVLRWYLSSFSASRKSTVAKKPYNPIIGMLLRLYWKLLLLYFPCHCHRRNIPVLVPQPQPGPAPCGQGDGGPDPVVRGHGPGVPGGAGVAPPARVRILRGVPGAQYLLHRPHLHQVSLPRTVCCGECSSGSGRLLFIIFSKHKSDIVRFTILARAA